MTAARSTEATPWTRRRRPGRPCRTSLPRPSPSARPRSSVRSARSSSASESWSRQTLTGLLANSHVLLEGVPGLGKTMLVRTIADVHRLHVQPDPVHAGPDAGRHHRHEHPRRRGRPAGLHVPVRARSSRTSCSPTRSTGRRRRPSRACSRRCRSTRSRSPGNRYKLEPPFFVLATQNPLEMEGTYPAARGAARPVPLQGHGPVSRREEDLITIMDRTTGADAPTATKVDERGARSSRCNAWRAPSRSRRTSRPTPWALLAATHPDQPRAPQLVRDYVRYGGSPRGAQALVTAGKIYALLDGRFNVSIEDIRAVVAAGAAAPRDPQLRRRGRGHHVRGDRPLDPGRGAGTERRIAAHARRSPSDMITPAHRTGSHPVRASAAATR